MKQTQALYRFTVSSVFLLIELLLMLLQSGGRALKMSDTREIHTLGCVMISETSLRAL